MNTLEEFEKRLSNLLDFINENSDELIHKHGIGLKLNYSEIGDNNQYTSELKIGVTFGITFAVYSLLEERPEFREFLEKTIEITKRLANDYRSKRR